MASQKSEVWPKYARDTAQHDIKDHAKHLKQFCQQVQSHFENHRKKHCPLGVFDALLTATIGFAESVHVRDSEGRLEQLVNSVQRVQDDVHYLRNT